MIRTRFSTLAAWGLLTVTAGCGLATQRLWEQGSEVVQVIRAQYAGPGGEFALVVESDDAGPRLAVDAELSPGAEVPAASGFAGARSAWTLRPGEEAESALVLLSDPAAFRCESVRLEFVRERRNGWFSQSVAQLVLTGQWFPERTVEAVPEVSIAALERVRRVPAMDYLQSYVLPGDTPQLLVDCTERLLALDPAIWVPGPKLGRPHLAALGWVDAELRPLQNGQHAARLIGPTAGGRGPLPDRLAALANLRILAVVHDGQQQEYYALRPDVVWLWAGLQRGHRGGYSHVSEWSVHPTVATAAAAEALAESSVWRGEWRLEFRDVERRTTAGADLTTKVLLTPLTVCVDFLGALVWGALTGD